MKKIPYLVIGLLAICVFIFVYLFNLNQETKKAEGAYPASIKKLSCLTSTGGYYSSTSPLYLLTTTASSTCVIDITHIKNLNLGIFLNSSTTPPTLKFTLAISINDNANIGPVATTTDWYRFKTYSDSGSIRTWNTGELFNTLTFSSSTRYHLIPVTDLRGQFLRVDYGVIDAAANVAIEAYADID